jgi:nitrite reductase/ring-hydroxylating ferredoxin subunit
MAKFMKVAHVDDIPEGQGVAVEVEGKRIALFNIDGELFAVEATCAQHRAPLEKGIIHARGLQCPWHGVAFDVARGICAAFPAEISASTYQVKVEGADILVAI